SAPEGYCTLSRVARSRCRKRSLPDGSPASGIALWLPTSMGQSISLLAVAAMIAAACGQVSAETPPKVATEEPATNDGGVSADGRADLGVPRCVPGQMVACACVNGQMGAQACQADGTYAACVCSSGRVDIDSSVVGDASFGDVAQERSSG